MNLVFADSGFWIGLRDKRDAYHDSSQKIAKWVINQRLQLVVTPFIFAEVYAYFCRARPLREQVVRDIWTNKIVRMEQPTFADQDRAVRLLEEYGDKNFSFADALSFVIIDRLKLRSAISYDDHFHQYGQFDVIDGRTF